MSQNKNTTDNLKLLAGGLRLAANAAFGDPVTAETWLTAKLATLKGKTPIEVAISSDEGYMQIAKKLRQILNSHTI